MHEKLHSIKFMLMAIGKVLLPIFIVLLVLIMLSTAITVNITKCTIEVFKELQEQNSSISQEFGKAIGAIVNEFEKGLDESRK